MSVYYTDPETKLRAVRPELAADPDSPIGRWLGFAITMIVSFLLGFVSGLARG